MLLISNTDNFYNQKHKHLKSIDVYGKQNDKIKGADEYYRLSNKEEIQKYLNQKLSLLGIDRKLAKVLDESKTLITNLDGESLHPSAMVDDESYFPRIGTGYRFTPDIV